MTLHEQLIKTTQHIATRGKGILAADESSNTIKKRFDTIKLESTEEHRRAYREMLFSTSGLEEYICGVILFEETLYQKTYDGIPFPKYLSDLGVVPGIKVDKGLINLAHSNEEKITQGLDGLSERMAEYKKAGAGFAKWRCVYNIGEGIPSRQAMIANAETLARYAAICQEHGIVPIVEPEVLIDGDHSLETCSRITEEVLNSVFDTLHVHHVLLEGMILKPSMVISGKSAKNRAKPIEVAEETVKVLKRTVPSAVKTINFLSGGQTSEEATLHLDLMNKLEHLPWNLSFSYGRALQDHALKAWHGKAANVEKAQAVFLKRMKLNSAAACGEYSESMEK